MSGLRSGLAAAVAAHALWGSFPLFWRLLEPAAPAEILAHRIAWSLVVLVLVLAVTTRFGWIRQLGRRRAALLALASVLISVNWGTFIYGVNSGHVVETSLGYFITPLLTVGLAVVVLKEKLSRLQGLAVGIAAAAVAVLAVDYGRPPWIALILAFSFGSYGLVKKRVGISGTESLAFETAVVFVPAVAYIAWLEWAGDSTFMSEGPGHASLLAVGGIVTAVPLMLFGRAAIRLPLTTLGLIQYLTPVLHFLLGVLIYEESMPPSRLAGFVLVWLALAVFTVDAVRGARRPSPVETGGSLAAGAPVRG